MKRKCAVIIITAFIFTLLLFPIRLQYKDGGTVEYKAILYSVIKKHSATDENGNPGFHIGTIVELFGIELYNQVQFVPLDEVNQTKSKKEKKHDCI